MKKALMAAAAALPMLLIDLAGVAGVCLIAWGFRQIYVPAGYIAAGALLLAGAVLLGRKSE